MTPLALPGSSSGRPRRTLQRLRDFLLGTWRGRCLLASVVVLLLDGMGLPLPGQLTGLAHVIVWYVALPWAAWRLFRRGLRRLLWKIRTKLILSYLFIAVVPLVLLCTLFVLAGVFFSGLLASHLVSA